MVLYLYRFSWGNLIYYTILYVVANKAPTHICHRTKHSIRLFAQLILCHRREEKKIYNRTLEKELCTKISVAQTTQKYNHKNKNLRVQAELS